MAVRRIDIDQLSQRVSQLSKTFAERIVGQEEATTAFAKLLEKYLSGFYDRERPIGTLLLLGPTGTGKTSSVEAFVEGVFGSKEQLIKIDCAEFQHSHEIAKLVGSPPGYLGHRETHPMITNERIQAGMKEGLKFSVLLFDEIEKASDALWNLLLGIMDKGVLTLGTNEKVDLRPTIIVMTSNVGSREVSDAVGGGFGFVTPEADEVNDEDLKDISFAAARRKFTPEFLNRIDEMVMFSTLTPKDLDKIFDLEMNLLLDTILQTDTLVLPAPSPGARKEILREGFDKRYNARNLRRVIEKRIVVPVARAVCTRQALGGDKVIIDFKDGKWFYYAECAIQLGKSQGVSPVN